MRIEVQQQVFGSHLFKADPTAKLAGSGLQLSRWPNEGSPLPLVLKTQTGRRNEGQCYQLLPELVVGGLGALLEGIEGVIARLIVAHGSGICLFRNF